VRIEQGNISSLDKESAPSKRGTSKANSEGGRPQSVSKVETVNNNIPAEKTDSMNDALIRKRFHEQELMPYHTAPNALVIDELGLHHGSCRADIAIVNGRMIGYEIKGETDSLKRLRE